MPVVSLVNALKKAIPNWDPAKHPRDRDGQFIRTGDVVHVYSGPGVPEPEYAGRVVAAYNAPDGRLFVGVESYGYVRWARPKQIEHVQVKAYLNSDNKKHVDNNETPDLPIPTVDEQYDEIFYDHSDPFKLSSQADFYSGDLSGTITKSDIDSELLEMAGLENAAPPSTVEQPNEVVIPANKTPDDLLRMIGTSFANKHAKGTVDYPGGVDGFNSDLDAMLEDPDFQSATASMSKLMKAAKLGGKQVKRYNSILSQKHGGHQVMSVEPKKKVPDYEAGEFDDADVEYYKNLDPKLVDELLADTTSVLPGELNALKVAQAQLAEEAATAAQPDGPGSAQSTDGGGDPFPEASPSMVSTYVGILNGQSEEHTETLEPVLEDAKSDTEVYKQSAQMALWEHYLATDGTVVTEADLASVGVTIDPVTGWPVTPANAIPAAPAGPESGLAAPPGVDAGLFNNFTKSIGDGHGPTVKAIAMGKSSLFTDSPSIEAARAAMHSALGPDAITPQEYKLAEVVKTGDLLYAHPQGSVIVVKPGGGVLKFNPSGNLSSTSATPEKLAAGHGSWTHVGVGKSGLLTLAGATDVTIPQTPGTPQSDTVGAPDAASSVQPQPDQVAKILANIQKDSHPQALINAMEKHYDLYGEQQKVNQQHAVATWVAMQAEAAKPKIDESQNEVLGLLSATFSNKYFKGTIEYPGGTDQFAADMHKLLTSGDFDESAALLNQIMKPLALGGKQRKRYRDALAAKFGQGPSVIATSNTKGAGVWSPVQPGTGGVNTPAGVIGPSKGNALVNPAHHSPSSAKASIQTQLAERMRGKATLKELSAALTDTEYMHSTPIVQLGELLDSDGNVLPGKHLRKESTGYWTITNYPNSSTQPATKESLETALLETVANSLIQQWAGTSNDSNARSLAMQDLAVEEFGLSNTYEWPKGNLASAIEKEKNKHRKLYRLFLREQYNNTQEWAKANGIKKVRLIRGSHEYVGVQGSEVDVKLRPMSSFSTNRSTAQGFGSHRVEALVPVEWIIGTAATGYGCQNEYEWVVLGGVHKVRVVK